MKHTLLILTAILLLAVLLRTLTLFSVDLWRDEIWSMRWSRQDISVELNHSLHLALIAPWTRAMPDVVGVRVLSFWTGIIAVAATARLGYRVGGRRLAIFAAFLAAISPYLIAYSQEGRDYMLAVAFTTLGLAFWLESRLWVSALCLIGGIFSLGSTIFLVTGIDAATMLLVLRRKPVPARSWLLSHGLLYATTFGLNALVARSSAGAYLPVLNNMDLPRLLFRYVGIAQCGDGGSEILPCLTVGLILWPVLLIGLLVIARRLDSRALSLALVVSVPLAAVLFLHAVHYGLFVHRHLIITLPPLLCLWALLLVRWLRLSRILLTLLVIQAAFVLNLYYRTNPYKPNWREVVQYVQERGSDPVVTAHSLLNMLTEEAAYYFGREVQSGSPANRPFWFISLTGDDAPSNCVSLPDSPARLIFIFHCE